jgi:multiple sugar transport system permease protein
VQLIGSYPGLILTDLTFAVPFSIWLLAAYLAELPRDAEETAAVQGAASLVVLRRVLLPACLPTVLAVGTFAFALSWGEVQFASVLSDDSTRTVAVGLPELTAGTVPYWNQVMAGSLVAALPVVLVFILARRVLIDGLKLMPN